MNFGTLASLQFALVLAGVYWMLKKNDELPLLASMCLFYIASYRFWAVKVGLNIPADLSNFGFAAVTYDRSLSALRYIVLGELSFLVSYMALRTKPLPLVPATTDLTFLTWLRPKVIFTGIACLPLVLLVRGSVTNQTMEGRSMGFEVSSYLILLPLMLVGLATLLLCLWRFGGLPTAAWKFAAILCLSGLFHLTFSSAGRFQFLGWMITGSVVLSSAYKPFKRLALLCVVGALGMSVFAFAGAMRQEFAVQEFGMKKLTWIRAFSAEDANMLDGFVLLQQVYPSLLPYGHGREHLEVLIRPIPRKLWPGKPVGGYMNKLGLITANDGFTLGISPTLFGSLYGEGALAGVLIGSILYGIAFGSVVNLTRRIQPFGAVLIRACLCASLVPLLRGGDLPGIYAWIGMAFWPCFLLLWMKRKTLFSPAQPVVPATHASAAADAASFTEIAAQFAPEPGKKSPSRAIHFFRSGKPPSE